MIAAAADVRSPILPITFEINRVSLTIYSYTITMLPKINEDSMLELESKTTFLKIIFRPLGTLPNSINP